MSKAVISVLGKDQVGIIAKICSYLAKNNINILDISQTIVQDYFNMMMIVDASLFENDFSRIVLELDQLGKEIGVSIRLQHEDIFSQMHRI
ncbi:MAG: ACT domain-containing protein [Erysipelotrichaceae bacterium]|nr:ACT domain-containing protein [Erysipelotrichaceae bacterium]